jgi:hypothetical protein
LGVDGCLGQEPSNNAIEQTNGETRFVTPFAAHRERSADKRLPRAMATGI